MKGDKFFYQNKTKLFQMDLGEVGRPGHLVRQHVGPALNQEHATAPRPCMEESRAALPMIRGPVKLVDLQQTQLPATNSPRPVTFVSLMIQKGSFKSCFLYALIE